HSRYMRLDAFDAATVNALLEAMRQEAHEMVAQSARGVPVSEHRLAYMRYVGQGHEIPVALPVRELGPDDAAELRAAFEREYETLFARIIPGAALEILSWSVHVSTEETPPAPVGVPERRKAPPPAGRRSFFDARLSRFVEVPVYWRPALGPGAALEGPAIIAEDETSTFVSASFDAVIDGSGGIVLERRKPAPPTSRNES